MDKNFANQIDDTPENKAQAMYLQGLGPKPETISTEEETNYNNFVNFMDNPEKYFDEVESNYHLNRPWYGPEIKNKIKSDENYKKQLLKEGKKEFIDEYNHNKDRYLGPLTNFAGEYSDIHKDEYGFRPRYVSANDMKKHLLPYISEHFKLTPNSKGYKELEKRFDEYNKKIDWDKSAERLSY